MKLTPAISDRLAHLFGGRPAAAAPKPPEGDDAIAAAALATVAAGKPELAEQLVAAAALLKAAGVELKLEKPKEDETEAEKAARIKREKAAKKKEDGDEEDDEGEDKGDDEAKAKARAEGRHKGRTLERNRWAAVMSSEHAKGRVPAATVLASSTELKADAIIALLQTLPTETAAKPGAPAAREAPDGLAALLADHPRVELGAGGETGQADRNTAEGMLALVLAAGAKAGTVRKAA